MGAIHAALASLLRAGDRIVAPVALYGSTRTQLLRTFGSFGVRVDVVDTTNLDAVANALAAAPTRVLYAETIANPTTYLADHAALAGLAHRHGATYVVDNTFASPYLCRPLELGADLVIESATKYLGGHSDVIAGVVAGSDKLIAEVSRVQIDTGATLGPLEAFLVLRGILSLAVRVDRHAQTASALAAWLEGQDGVRSVLYPGLPSHPQYAVASRQFRPGVAGGMLAFEVEGGRDAGRAVTKAIRRHRWDLRSSPHHQRCALFASVAGLPSSRQSHSDQTDGPTASGDRRLDHVVCKAAGQVMSSMASITSGLGMLPTV